MRRTDREIKEKAAIEEIVRACSVLRLGMVDKDRPYVVPLNFGYQDGHFYVHSAREGRKITLIRENPNVCFELDILEKIKKGGQPCKWGAQYKSVIGQGTAVILDNIEEKSQGLAAIMAQYSDQKFEFPHKALEQTTVIRIDIREMTGKKTSP